MKVLKTAFALCVIAATTSVARAEEPQMPTPTPEHEALEAWVGSWTGTGEIKPGILGPGGEMRWNEECTWFENSRFYVVCESEGSNPMGPVTSLGIIGYDPAKKVYTHYSIDTNGWSAYAEGTHSGDTWTFTSDEVMGGATYHTRATMTMPTPEAVQFNWEVSKDGKTWTLLMDGTSAKK
jgi:hypothetical protein